MRRAKSEGLARGGSVDGIIGVLAGWPAKRSRATTSEHPSISARPVFPRSVPRPCFNLHLWNLSRLRVSNP